MPNLRDLLDHNNQDVADVMSAYDVSETEVRSLIAECEIRTVDEFEEEVARRVNSSSGHMIVE